MSLIDVSLKDIKIEVLYTQAGGFAPIRHDGIRATHTPTDVFVEVTEGRSAHRNRQLAIEKLTKRIQENAMRTDFEMTESDLADLLETMRPVPMIALQCGTPRSVQENANAAWAVLGKKMGFDPMTVQPTGQGDRFFSAVSVPAEKIHIKRDGASWCATAPGFINPQKSPAGFGDTPEEAIADLKAQGERNAE